MTQVASPVVVTLVLLRPICKVKGLFMIRPGPALKRHHAKPARYVTDEGSVKSALGGEHTESNHRLIYTPAWASPQQCLAPGAFAASKFHLCTVRSRSPH